MGTIPVNESGGKMSAGVSHSVDLVMEGEKQYRLTNQIITVLEAERDRLQKMVADNADTNDEIMVYVLFAWEKYAEAMDETANYFKALAESENKL